MNIKKKNDRLIVFDLDGTLIDSRADIAGSINAGLEKVAGVRRERDEIFPLIGQPLVEMYAKLLPESHSALVEEACAAYREHYMDNCANETTVFPGVERGLAALSEERCVVATTKATFQAERVTERMGLAGYFELVQGTDGIPYKPDPAVLHLVFEKLGGNPKESWMVGDTPFDVKAGKAAGMITCAVTYGIAHRRELADARPDFMVDTFDLAASMIALP